MLSPWFHILFYAVYGMIYCIGRHLGHYLLLLFFWLLIRWSYFLSQYYRPTSNWNICSLACYRTVLIIPTQNETPCSQFLHGSSTFKRIIALLVQLKYFNCSLVHLLYMPISKTLSLTSL